MPNNGNVSRVVTRNSAHSTTLSPWSVKVNGKSGHFAFVTLTSKHISNIISVFFFFFFFFHLLFFFLFFFFFLKPNWRGSRKVLSSAPGSGRRGQRWSEVKVQDVSHRTGQGGGTHIGGGHGKVQRHGGEEREEEAVVTTKNDGEMWKGRRKGGSNGGGCWKEWRRRGRVQEENGGTWHQEKGKKQRRELWGKVAVLRGWGGGKEAESIPLKKTEPK